jgi:hypothetical protein
VRVAFLALLLIGSFSFSITAHAAPSDSCKQCSDHRKRCLANYPGPTCKVDHDICIKNCRNM